MPATFDAFALLSPGEKFEDRPLKGIVRRAELDPGAPPGRKPRGANYVSFHYDAGCGNRISDIDGATIYACDDPLEIQIWPACERNLSSYGKSLPRDELVVRGTPAALFERGRRLEIYTDDATVVIFGQDTDEVMRAAASLKSVNATARGKAETVTGQNLETPILGALKGTAECGQTLDWNN